MKQNAIVIDPGDNVATLLVDLDENQRMVAGEDLRPCLRQAVPAGHKVALRNLETGEAILKYGHPIGFASRRIVAGEHVHIHNLTWRED